MDKKEVTKGLSKARRHYKKYERTRINRTVRRTEKATNLEEWFEIITGEKLDGKDEDKR